MLCSIFLALIKVASQRGFHSLKSIAFVRLPNEKRLVCVCVNHLNVHCSLLLFVLFCQTCEHADPSLLAFFLSIPALVLVLGDLPRQFIQIIYFLPQFLSVLVCAFLVTNQLHVLGKNTKPRCGTRSSPRRARHDYPWDRGREGNARSTLAAHRRSMCERGMLARKVTPMAKR